MKSRHVHISMSVHPRLHKRQLVLMVLPTPINRSETKISAAPHWYAHSVIWLRAPKGKNRYFCKRNYHLHSKRRTGDGAAMRMKSRGLAIRIERVQDQ